MKFDLSYLISADGAPGPIAFDWHLVGASSGTLQTDPTTHDATFVCTALGTQTIELTVSGGDPAGACQSSVSVAVDCTTLCGNGTVDPGEACDPPDGTTCDSSCNVLNHCPVITSLVVDNPNVYLGATTTVTVAASDPDPADTLTYAWSSAGGTVVASPASATATFSCNLVGPDDVRVTVSDGKCSAQALAPVACLPACGNGLIDPGETCDPPNGTTCNQSCQTVAMCGDGIVESGEGCDLGPTTPVLCRSCKMTNCGGCFVSQGGGAGLCTGLNAADTQACNALVTCTANNMGSCASSTGAHCYCLDTNFLPGHTPLYCATGPADGVCAAQFEALAHSNDPVVVMAQINDPTTPVGKVAAAAYSFAHSPCGPPCFVYNN